MAAHPTHDDIMDALSSAIDISIAPSRMAQGQELMESMDTSQAHPRFGGWVA